MDQWILASTQTLIAGIQEEMAGRLKFVILKILKKLKYL